ncbi:MAG: lactate racemase domain-containing protein [Planctomycetota bacterium]
MKFVKVRQQLVSNPIQDVTAEVYRQLDAIGPPPQGEVAVTVGSRGINNLVEITRAAGDWLRDHGATPFIVPAMGSHNGATAEGQQEMVESLGCTEAATDMPIRSSMECVKVGEVPTGDVWMDRHCYESAGVLVVNRIKLHTCFAGPVQSGLAKMMVVGMGKIRSAQTFHSTPTPQMKDMLLEMGQLLVDSGKVWAGLAILEDGYDKTAELHAVQADDIRSREPELLAKHREYFPSLPLDDINCLIVDQIGKTFSGTGMDPNVIGRRGTSVEDVERPQVKIIACLELVEASKGNAIGVGLADFITRRLRDAIDEHKTFVNVYTTGDMQRGKIPATLGDDDDVFEKMRERYGEHRWVVVPNTLHLDQMWVTEDLAEELRGHDRCDVTAESKELTFADGKHQLAFSD